MQIAETKGLSIHNQRGSWRAGDLSQVRLGVMSVGKVRLCGARPPRVNGSLNAQVG